MNPLRDLVSRLAGLLRRRHPGEFDEELLLHLEMLVDENLRRGMTPAEARRAARIELGGADQIREACHDQRGLSFLGTLLQDLRYGARQLRRSPGFTAVVVLTLALGIGANTAIFSLLDALMLRTLPVKDPQQLVLLNWVSTKWPDAVRNLSGNSSEGADGSSSSTSFSYPAFEQFAATDHLFSALFGFADLGRMNVNANGQATLANGEMVTGEYFSGLGVVPILGRAITAADAGAGAPPVAVLSYAYWESRFGADPSVLGKTIALDASPFTIIGVAPPEFFGVSPGQAVDVWIPVSAQRVVAPDWASLTARDDWWLVMMGRRSPGVSDAQIRAGLDVAPPSRPPPASLPRPSLKQFQGSHSHPPAGGSTISASNSLSPCTCSWPLWAWFY